MEEKNDEVKEETAQTATEQEVSVEEAGEEEAKAEEIKEEEPAESMENYSKELEASFRKISKGDIITGTVMEVSEEGVTLDLHYYTQGVIEAADMSDTPGFSVMRDVKEGDEIEARVIKMDDGNGNIKLSRKAAKQELAWDKLKEYLDDKTTLSVKIAGITKAGVICYVEDVRGFIPASQLSVNYVEDVNPWLGKTVDARVITVDKEKKKLVLSAKVVERENAKAEREQRIAMMVPGTVLEGSVESIMPYGAFIDLGDGLSGLVHVSQISQKRVKTPADVLSVGDKVKVKVLGTNNGKISLSMKALEEAEPSDSRPGRGEKGSRNDRADKTDDFHYKSDGNATTSLGSILANLKID